MSVELETGYCEFCMKFMKESEYTINDFFNFCSLECLDKWEEYVKNNK